MRTQHQTKRELDKIDRNILRILQNDGRISFTELGEKVGLSTTPCTERVRRLEREGIIMGYNARLNPQHLKGSLLVFVEISLTTSPATPSRSSAAPCSSCLTCWSATWFPAILTTREGAHFGDGLLPQAARRHSAQAATRARVQELHRDGRSQREPLPADSGVRLRPIPGGWWQ